MFGLGISALRGLGAAIIGIALALIGNFLLVRLMEGNSSGSSREMTFKIALSVIALGGLAVAAFLSLRFGQRDHLVFGVVLALVVVVVGYSLLALPVSVGNECATGIAFPIGVPGCD